MMNGKHTKSHTAQITKRNQKCIWIGFSALVFLLAGMTLLKVMPSNESRFSRKVEDFLLSGHGAAELHHQRALFSEKG